jgi:gliding motility-associated-like protein
MRILFLVIFFSTLFFKSYSSDSIVAIDDFYEIFQDIPTILAPTGNDIIVSDSFDFEVSIISSNTIGGAIVLGDNKTISYIPQTNFIGFDTIKYNVCFVDTNICNSAKIVISMLPNAPDAINDLANTNQNTSVNINVLQNDQFFLGLGLNVSISFGAKNGSATINPNRTITYTPSNNFVGTDSFTYKVCYTDYPSICDEAKVRITVLPNAPIINNDLANTNQNTALNINVLQNDIVNPNLDLTMTIATIPQSGIAVINPNRTITYTPNLNFIGVDTFRYKVCYTAYPFLCDDARVTITTTPSNPVANNDLVSTNEDNPININVLINDIIPFGLQVVLTLNQSPKKGTASLGQNNTINYNPNLNYNGFDTLKYRICIVGFPDKCDDATIFIQINPVNDKPLAVDDIVFISKNDDILIDVLSNDIDYDKNGLDISIVQQPQNGILTLSGGKIEYTPNLDFTGIDTGFYQICNKLAPSFCDTARIIINVGADNNAPTANNDSITVDENDNTVNILANDFDIDGDVFTYEIISQPKHGSLEDDGLGNINYLPGATFAGLDSFQYQICDITYFSKCDVAWVYVTSQKFDIEIPNSFSPNGDGVNDIFVIKGLGFYPDNELIIFNRWGEIVLTQKGYDNTWQGELRGAKRSAWGNGQVQDGSYFYILTINGKEAYKGYIVIKR